MCGIPGAGKSTWIAKNKDFLTGTVEVVSRDDIRFSLLGKEDSYFAKEDEVWAKFINDAIESLKYNNNTILDATHLNPASRSKVFRALGNNLKNVEINVIYFDCPLEIALERNEGREGRKFVPRGGIRRMYFSLVPPSLENEPTIDKIYEIDVINDNKLTIKERL